MEVHASLHRRRLLAGLAGVTLTGSLAGCTGDDDDGGNGSGDGDNSSSENDDGGGDDSADEDSDDSADEDSDDSTDEDSDDSADEDSDDSADGNGEVPEADDLNLREANVVGVEFEDSGGGYRFDVALHHDDDGEEGYANWWQVERLDGSQLGRRELLHAHSRQPFTRSETIEVPDDVACVVVRGHDQTHGYGGVAMVVTLESGATRVIDQGSDRQSFADADCP